VASEEWLGRLAIHGRWLASNIADGSVTFQAYYEALPLPGVVVRVWNGEHGREEFVGIDELWLLDDRWLRAARMVAAETSKRERERVNSAFLIRHSAFGA
jgi:hypothetical protein